MSFICPNCLRLAAAISALATGEDTTTGAEQPIIHHISSEHEDACKLCILLRSKIRKQLGYEVKVWPAWEKLNELDGNLSLREGQEGFQNRSLTGVKVQPVQGSLVDPESKVFKPSHVLFPTFCLWDSSAASNTLLSHRYQFHHTGSSDAIEMIRTWLKSCRFSHERCRVGDFSDKVLDDNSELPTRIIDVGPKDGSLEPRLLMPNGLRGRWIALSHCWGSQHLQPLKTTRQNFTQHQKRIQMSSLPKTFHDAVLVARALDIRYLWIDSLCIVQDDKNDKKRELPRMGSIYQNAHLTILASEATNCSDGLFFDALTVSHNLVRNARKEGEWSNVETESGMVTREGIRSVAQRVELPFTYKENIQGSYFITSVPEDEMETADGPERFPRFTPLFSRAWVTQEWTLSRRSISFLRDGIVWSCREYCENESGSCLALQRPNMDDWQIFIEEYSSGSLTFEGDRLKAIQGLVTSLRGKREDEYFAGLCDGDLPDNLLWRVRWDKKVSKELLYVPSWSWARHIGLIGFQLHGGPRFRGSTDSSLINIAETPGLSHSGALRLRAYFGWVRTIEEFDFHLQYRHKAFLKFGFRGYSSCRQVVPLRESVFSQLQKGGLDRKGLSVILDQRGPMGWADWDLGSIPDGPVAWVALKLERNCLQQFSFGCSDALHVLFLRPEPDSLSDHRFERVGMGVIACTEQLSRMELSDLEII